MAIGDNNYGSNTGYQNKPFEATYYSRLKFRNGSSQLSVNYRSGLMQLDLGNVSEGYKVESAGSIYLSPIKAHMLVDQLNGLFKYIAENKGKIDTNVAFGVNAGMGEKISFIAFSSDNDEKIYATIGKFDGSGAVIESHKFEFSKDYNYALDWENLESNDLAKSYYNLAEINMLKNALEDFSRSMNGAYGYAVADTARWDAHRMNRRIDQIFDKLGIERPSYNGGGNRGTNNFLNNAATSNKTTLEDVEDLLV